MFQHDGQLTPELGEEVHGVGSFPHQRDAFLQHLDEDVDGDAPVVLLEAGILNKMRGSEEVQQ